MPWLWISRWSRCRDCGQREPLHLTHEASTLGSFKLATINVARRLTLARRLHMWWRYLIGPQVSLQMVCTKNA
jgi:hypothetical protein